MAKKKKDETLESQVHPENKIVSPDSVDLHELFTRLKEFENKVLLERLKVLERNITLIHKEQLQTKKHIANLLARVESLHLSYDELINCLGLKTEPEEEPTVETHNDVEDKTWN